MRLALGVEVERLEVVAKITVLFTTVSTMAQNRGEMMLLPPVKTNNGVAGECS